MRSTLTSKCRITIPKKIRETLGLGPGSRVEFDVDEAGRIVIRKAGEPPKGERRKRDRFDLARGRATVKWRTDELMQLLRGGDD